MGTIYEVSRGGGERGGGREVDTQNSHCPNDYCSEVSETMLLVQHPLEGTVSTPTPTQHLFHPSTSSEKTRV